jgi:hypothetical protein
MDKVFVGNIFKLVNIAVYLKTQLDLHVKAVYDIRLQ